MEDFEEGGEEVGEAVCDGCHCCEGCGFERRCAGELFFKWVLVDRVVVSVVVMSVVGRS